MTTTNVTTTNGIVLWDIDGTLCDVRGNGRKAFAVALARTWGVVDELHDVKFLGGTDLDVLAHLRTRLTLDPAHDARFFDVMHDALTELVAGMSDVAIPGAADVVNTLHARGFTQGLVTGNARRCAYVKVKAAGIDATRFPFGGFGDEHGDRNELAKLALSRAGRSSERVVLVGDTPNDIRAAHAINAVAVALTSKHYDRSALKNAGADVVVDDLREVIAAL